MKTFHQWVEFKKLDLPTLTDTEPAKGATSEGGTIARRFRFGHPDAEAASQYPQAYFAARMPDAFLQMQWRKQQKMTAPSNGAP